MPGAPECSPTVILLRDCVRGASRDELARALEAACASGEDVLATADTQQLQPLLYVRLTEAGLVSTLTPERWELLRVRYGVHLVSQARLLETAVHALSALHAAGLRSAMPIKGVAATALLSSSLPARGIGDVDLLIEPSEGRVAQEVLLGCGFRLSAYPPEWFRGHHHSAPLLRDGVAVELHTGLWTPGWLPFVTPDVQALAERAIETRLCGAPIVCPCPEDCIIAAVLIAARDGLVGTLGQWADVYWLLSGSTPPADLERLWRLSRDLRTRGLLAIGLRFVAELFGDGPARDHAMALATGAAYDRLRPTMWRRVLDPHNPALQRHRRVALWIERLRGREPGPHDRRSPETPPAPSVWPVLTYVADLALSRPHRAELRDELLLRRIYRELAATSEAP